MTRTHAVTARVRRIIRNVLRLIRSEALLAKHGQFSCTGPGMMAASSASSKSSFKCLSFFLPVFVLTLVAARLFLTNRGSTRFRTYSMGSVARIPLPSTFGTVRPLLSDDEVPQVELRVFVAPFTTSLTSSAMTEKYTVNTLLRLLNSLREARYGNNTVNLHIILSPHASSTSFDAGYAIVQTFGWPHGLRTITNATVGGPYDGLVSAWQPARGERCTSVLVEALEAEPFEEGWFDYLRSVQKLYGNMADVGAFALQPAKLPGGKLLPGVREGQEEHLIFYEGVPGLSKLALVSSDVWRSFSRWFVAQRGEWFLWPVVVGAKDKKDSAWDQFHGTTRAHWTHWFSRFCALHGLYTVYPRQLPLPIILPDNLNANGGMTVLKLKLDGSLENNIGHSGHEEGVDAEAINAIVALGRNYGGVVSMTVVNQAFLETARSWVCNVDTAGIRPPGVVWIATDDEAYDGLKNVRGSYAVRMRGMKGGVSGTAYGTPGYWLLMLERTRLIRDVLDNGVAVFAFETDQVWLRDPLPFVMRIVRSGDEVDIVGTLDTRHEIGGNFLFLNPTLATRRVWREVFKRFSKAYHGSRMDRRSSKSHKYIENDQSTLTKLVLFDTSFKAGNPVVFRALDTDLFVDGRWYGSERGKYYKANKSRSPILLNNNFLIGIENKKQRLMKVGHWFVTQNGTCDGQAVRNAIAENERQAEIFMKNEIEFGLTRESRNQSSETVARRIEGSDFESGMDAAIAAVAKELSS